ncbi:MAG TPA: DUF4058 family protein [Ardenticatenaceae bacterium]|nr:DUF4058 family protein [Ardenticatenaceae bacterium]
MPSPFPGMDPYVEGHLWPDVHQRLAAEIGRQLGPKLRPRYVARLAVSVFTDAEPEVEVGIMYPDVEVLKAAAGNRGEATPRVASAAPLPPTLTIPIVPAIEVRLIAVEIRDAAGNQLVTSIEILSPVNKRGVGLAQYQEKRRRLYAAGVHLLELDLLRRGRRALTHPRVPTCAYLIALTRAGSGRTGLWPLQIQDPLPELPVPLRPPDSDVVLELGAALTTIYDEAAYDLSIDYRQAPPPPPLEAAEDDWIRELLQRST